MIPMNFGWCMSPYLMHKCKVNILHVTVHRFHFMSEYSIKGHSSASCVRRGINEVVLITIFVLFCVRTKFRAILEHYFVYFGPDFFPSLKSMILSSCTVLLRRQQNKR